MNRKSSCGYASETSFRRDLDLCCHFQSKIFFKPKEIQNKIEVKMKNEQELFCCISCLYYPNGINVINNLHRTTSPSRHISQSYNLLSNFWCLVVSQWKSFDLFISSHNPPRRTLLHIKNKILIATNQLPTYYICIKIKWKLISKPNWHNNLSKAFFFSYILSY
jgi:hypothetical protein